MPFIWKAESMLHHASGVCSTLSSTRGCLYPGKPVYCLVGIIISTTQYNAHIGARRTLWMDNVILLLFWLNCEGHLTIADSTEFCTSLSITPVLRTTSYICMTPLILSFLSSVVFWQLDTSFFLFQHIYRFLLVFLEDPSSFCDSIVLRS